MPRIPTPATIDAAPPQARASLELVKKQLGSVPNLFRVIANSPAALEGYLGLSGALGKGALDARTRERIALAVAESNGCGYCLSAHTYLAKNSPSSTMPRSPRTEMALRTIQRPMQPFVLRPRLSRAEVTSRMES